MDGLGIGVAGKRGLGISKKHGGGLVVWIGGFV